MEVLEEFVKGRGGQLPSAFQGLVEKSSAANGGK
jgi:hypothetical protein